MHVYSLNEAILSGLRMLPTRVMGYVTKIPIPDTRKFVLSWCQSHLRDSQNKINSFPFIFSFLCIPEVEGKSLLLNTPHASDIGLTILYLNVSLQYSSHSNRIFNASCEKRSNQYFYPAVMPMNYIMNSKAK